MYASGKEFAESLCKKRCISEIPILVIVGKVRDTTGLEE